MDIIRPARGDWGAVLTFQMRKADDTALDISSATTLRAYVVKPDGETSALAGTMVGDGSEGYFTITMAEGVLDLEGEYLAEPEAVFATAALSGTPHRFTVRPSARA